MSTDTPPLTDAELAELTASIEHLSGPDAWDEDRLESALIPVTHYVPRLLAEVERAREEDPFVTAMREAAVSLKRTAIRVAGYVVLGAAVWNVTSHFVRPPWAYPVSFLAGVSVGAVGGACLAWIEERREARRDA